MKIAIVGSRTLFVENIGDFLSEGLVIDAVISGGARGIDGCAKKFAEDNGLPYVEVLPEYNRYGRAAPIIRNRSIVDTADVVFIFWDGESSGTRSVIRYCEKTGTEAHVILLHRQGSAHDQKSHG